MAASGDTLALSADGLFDGSTLRSDVGVLLRGGRVVEVFDRSQVSRGLDVEHHSGLLVPGFVDLQVNGGGGRLFNDDPTPEGIAGIAAAHRAQGTTSLLPTLVSPSRALIQQGLAAASKAIEEMGSNHLRILGIHIEGPHLNPARSGAHERSQLRPCEPDDLAILGAFEAGTTLVTLAPECVPVGAVETLCDAGVRVFAGHSEASPEAVALARAAGLRGFTHLFNAMPPLGGRAPGIVGAALADGDAYAGIIADGAHIDWTTFRSAFAALGPRRLFFVSDAMPPVGAERAAPFSLGGAAIETRGEGDTRYCALPDGTLAGSCLTMAAALRNTHRYAGIPLDAALRMATATPAAALGRGAELGALIPGAYADLVLLDTALATRAVWVGGNRVA